MQTRVGDWNKKIDWIETLVGLKKKLIQTLEWLMKETFDWKKNWMIEKKIEWLKKKIIKTLEWLKKKC